MSDNIRLFREGTSLLAKSSSQPKGYRTFFVLLGLAIVSIVGIFVSHRVFAISSVISEDFSSSAANFTTVVGGTWTVSNGTYKLTSPAGPTDAAKYDNADYAIHSKSITGDFSVSVDETRAGSGGYIDASVMFDWKDANNYYYASISSTAESARPGIYKTTGIYRVSGGTHTLLAGFPAAYPSNVLHKVVVTRSGSNISLKVDGTVLGNVADSQLPTSGRLGIGTRNDTVTFDNFVVTVPGDVTPPTTPINLKSTSSTPTSVSLAWTASTDNVGVTGYRIYRNNVQVGSTSATSYIDTGRTAGTSYAYTVAAVDAAANLSPKSTTLNLKTPVFVHPGVLVDRTQLDFVKAKIAANQEPWKSAFTNLQASGSSTKTTLRPASYRLSSLSYIPAPVPVVKCTASYGKTYALTHPEAEEAGCSEQVDDARAAYADALQWYYTGDPAYAQKAIEIMNAWSATLTEIKFDQPRSDTGKIIFENGKLQAAWTAETIVRAAEIIRYTYTPAAGQPTFDVLQFSTMLDNVFLPLVITGWSGGANWLTSFSEATMNIGIFNDNRSTFDSGVAYWRDKVPTTIYMTSDGSIPLAPSGGYNTPAKVKTYWYNPNQYIDGLQGETCRDLGHMLMGLEAMTNAAETARIQGVDLYGEQKNRIVAAYELNASYVNAYIAEKNRVAPAAVASTWRPANNWVCPGFNIAGENGRNLGWEIAYNEYANRLGVSMPQTQALITQTRQASYKSGLHMNWETLTHAGTP